MSTSEDPDTPTPEQPTEAPLTYEQARDQLVEVVRQLESGGAPLAESMALWERGEKLAATCQRWLDGARQKVEQSRADVQAQQQQ